MTDDSHDHLIDALTEDFVTRYRLGERPSISEYELRHPEMADEIRELFPALVMMEQARSQDNNEAAYWHSGDNGQHPKQLGEYRILREVGRGGMGIVYEAVQESLGRHVALKLLPSQAVSNTKYTLRFQREARAAAKLHHPNIVPVFGIGEADGVNFYAMQFIQGMGLDRVATEVKRLRSERTSQSHKSSVERDRRLPNSQAAANSPASLAEGLLSGVFRMEDDLAVAGSPEFIQQSSHSSTSAISEQQIANTIKEGGRDYWNSIARIGIQVAGALQYAASQGVLHRDIKPANLLLDLTGNVWVTDFGLAKADDSDELTNPGDIVGTIRYLAPERLKGVSDLGSDIYSLGATLYELLVLKPMFDGVRREQLLSMIADVDPVRPRLIDASIPSDLETIVLKCISKDSLDRYVTATEVADDLQRFLDDRPINAKRIRLTEQFWRWCRRNQLIASLLAVASMLIVVLGVGALATHAIQSERDLAIESRQRAESSASLADQLRLRAEDAERESRIRAHLAQANVFRQSGREGQRLKCLEEIRAAANLSPLGHLRDDLRDTAIAAMALTDIRAIKDQSLTANSRYCFDHSLKHFAAIPVAGDRSLTVYNIDDNSVAFRQREPDFDYWHVELMYSKDDRFLLAFYFLRDNTQRVRVTDLQTGVVSMSSSAISSSPGQCWASHPIKSLIVFAENPQELVVRDMFTGDVVRRISLQHDAGPICFDAIGNVLAVSDVVTNEIALIDFQTGNEIGRLVAPPDQIGAPVAIARSYDDRLLAVSRHDGVILVWNVPTQQLVSVLNGHVSAVTLLEFAHQSHLLVTFSWDNVGRMWNAATGACLCATDRVLTTISADDREVGFVQGNEYGICAVAFENEIQTLHDPNVGTRTGANDSPGMTGVHLSHDERLLAIFDSMGISLWDTNDRRKLHHINMDHCSEVMFRDDGSEFITVSEAGVLRWPMSSETLPSEIRLKCGPPEKLAVEISVESDRADLFLSGSILAVRDNANSRIVLLYRSISEKGLDDNIRSLPSEHQRISNIAVSPDGKWLAAGSHRMPNVQVWNLQTGERISFPHGDGKTDISFAVVFSNDSQQLVVAAGEETASRGYYFFKTASWERLRFQHGTAVAKLPVFSPRASIFSPQSSNPVP